MRLWYVRRGVPWAPLLACCLLGLAAAAAGRQWPGELTLLLPAALACCAAAAAFVYDESATAVVAVTPRGAGWRRGTRLAVAGVPLATWLLVVVALPAEAAPDRPAWVIVGAASVLLAVGGAGLASRHGVTAPGSAISAAVAGLVLTPLVVGPFTGWPPAFPQGEFGAGLLAFWAVLAGLGLLLTGWVLRPGLH